MFEKHLPTVELSEPHRQRATSARRVVLGRKGQRERGVHFAEESRNALHRAHAAGLEDRSEELSLHLLQLAYLGDTYKLAASFFHISHSSPYPRRQESLLTRLPSIVDTEYQSQMARGNQRDKAREANLKKMAEQKKGNTMSGTAMAAEKEKVAAKMREKQAAAFVSVLLNPNVSLRNAGKDDGKDTGKRDPYGLASPASTLEDSKRLFFPQKETRLSFTGSFFGVKVCVLGYQAIIDVAACLTCLVMLLANRFFRPQPSFRLLIKRVQRVTHST
ncbi:4F5 domain protein [Drepanopeziza brunnea f. sp. 'multigermtubi' MB_m1]|uniref:4F5 domain protein n=1 Tax=Marssonina brunnea f. sp. multigermtubi (strain MB_m1) TaxID=1072389 RepID=K1WG44_MARBU|nr:4F5 domain protein [Drepanopeziza brunnea f. sp. 'multigermtubi' MB_m1]EKD16490.1 4F5 domain protein [Drepanopeziza brunnea f. sp. 'multigermtubi' MB_m1]